MPIPKPNKGESKKDFTSRCMGNAVMVKEFSEVEQRMAVCSSQWKKKATQSEASMSAQLQILSTNLSGIVRHDRMEGREFLVVPMVMAVEGVISGSEGPLLYPREELAKFPSCWNHQPVVVYHPIINGQGVSACEPDLLTTHKVGVVMHTKYEDGKLKAEAWVEKERIDAVDARVGEAIENNVMMEVSTGLLLESDGVAGEWQGIPYVGTARNLRPDHLALLPDKIGACSIEDGAGFLRNELSAQAIKDQLEGLARAAHGDENDDYVWVVDVFDTSYIYEKKDKLFRQGYSLSDSKVLIAGIPEEVIRRYEYEVANGQKRIHNVQYIGVTNMDMKKVIDELIGSKLWGEDDRKFLESQNEEGLKILQARNASQLKINGEAEAKTKAEKEAKAKADVEAKTKADAEVKANEDKSSKDKEGKSPKTPLTADQYIANAPKELQEVLVHGQKTLQAVRAKLIDTITANEGCPLTAEQLATRGLDDLQIFAAMCPVSNEDPDFSGLGPVTTTHKQEPLLMPEMTWDSPKR